MTSEQGSVREPTFSDRVIHKIKSIPHGRVASYGQIAALAGSPRAARQVVWLLHSSSRKHGLPWHRVINRQGGISLDPGQGYEIQKAMLEAEGVQFDQRDQIDLSRYGWGRGGDENSLV